MAGTPTYFKDNIESIDNADIKVIEHDYPWKKQFHRHFFHYEDMTKCDEKIGNA